MSNVAIFILGIYIETVAVVFLPKLIMIFRNGLDFVELIEVVLFYIHDESHNPSTPPPPPTLTDRCFEIFRKNAP